MKSYYAYIRVSTTRQGERGSSLQEQRAAIENYARRSSLHIEAWFEEQETAAVRGRRLFSEMLLALTRHRAAGVIIHKIDRSARNLRDWADLGELIDRGIEVHFANESLDLTSRGGRLSADIQAVVASDYIRNLREEVRKGFYGRLKQGLYPLPAPLGYRDEGGGKAKSIDPITGPYIRVAFDLYASGRYNLDSLADELHRRGFRARTGRRVGRSVLSEILRNQFYIGIIKIKRTGESFQGIHDPLVSARLFHRVQGVLAGRTKHRGLKHDHLYRKIVRCEQCGRALVAETQKGLTYYRCHAQSCKRVCVREELIDHGIIEALNDLVLSKEELGELAEEFKRYAESATTNETVEQQSLRLKIAAVTVTGSEEAGRRIAETAGAHLKKTVLELGGSDAFIILEDADLELTIKNAVLARVRNTGQSCTAAKRFIVVKKVAKQFTEGFVKGFSKLKVGDPMDETVEVGPIAREDLLEQLDHQVKKSVDMGATLLHGGNTIDRDGYFYEPTILGNVKKGMPAYDEEIFGPVASIIVVKDEEEAVRVANDTHLGLGSSVWINDIFNAFFFSFFIT
jgi:DNA invertase Pin-like site-specific DNA recombinase